MLRKVQEGLDEIRSWGVDVGEATITASETEDKDWINNWKEFFHQFYVDDILIKPSWEEVQPEDRDKLLIQIDPGTAFGTGMHETTQLCIRQLRKYLTPETVLLDVGTVSYTHLDSISVYPAGSISDKVKATIEEYTRRLARSLHVIGLINIQFIAVGDEVYVIEVNPRSSRTVPYISKVTGIPIVPLATRVILGHKIKDLGYQPGLQPEADYYAVKMPVFSFEKIRGADISLGPEMKSTGECLGIAKTFNEALYKAFLGAGIRLPKHKNMIITVRDEDKEEAVRCV